jgi:predicted Rossmann fold nucleotide-binding protein DprA/Smf involved in DNA uptake
VCHSDDILRALGLDNLGGTTFEPGQDKQTADPVMRALEPGPRLPEDLANATGLPLPQVLSDLSRLELEGLVIRDPGGMFAVK